MRQNKQNNITTKPMEKNKMTSVEWLIQQLQAPCRGIPSHIIEHAKEMHKDQIIDAHGDEQSHLQDDGTWKMVTAEQYYNETYGKE